MEDFKQKYSHDLEELRRQQEGIKTRMTSKKPPNEKQKEYARRVYATTEKKSENELGAALLAIQNNVKRMRPKGKTKPLCDYQTARKLVWTAFKTLAERKGFNPCITPGLKNVLPLLTAYFTGNETLELDLSKGIYLYGPCGSGKTFAMKAIQLALMSTNYSRMFKLNSVPRIFDDILESENIVLSHYYTENRCFDDIGFDNKSIKHYGNDINPMQTIFTHRYNRFQQSGEFTHLTSNLPLISGSSESLANRFDERVISRFREMFNFILLDGDDLRRV